MGSAELMLLGGLFLAAYSVYNFVSALLTNKADKDLLSWASGQEPVKSKSSLINWSRPLVHQFTLQHALRIQSPTYRKRIEKIVLISGLSRELNVEEFIGLQILWGVMFPLLMLVCNFALDLGLPSFALILIMPIGFYLPILHANREARFRENSVVS